MIRPWRWVALLGISNLSFAAGPLPNSPVRQDTTDRRYANDLDSADSHDRLYAARVLQRRVKEAWRIGGLNGDHLRIMEARQKLADFDELVAPRCARLLHVNNLLGPCARILGLLETPNALDPLRKIDHTDIGLCQRRAIQRAIKRIEAAQ